MHEHKCTRTNLMIFFLGTILEYKLLLNKIINYVCDSSVVLKILKFMYTVLCSVSKDDLRGAYDVEWKDDDVEYVGGAPYLPVQQKLYNQPDVPIQGN